MAKLECAVLHSEMKPLTAEPVLSIVVPTFHRPTEMAQTIASICDQLKDGLETKVEVIASDNGSGPETGGVILELAERYPMLSYVLNARDEGGFFNFFAAPWRARGRFTWVFGSDDILLDGGAANMVTVLEREDPSFLTMNKQVLNADLTQRIWDSTNIVPSRRFDTFLDMFCALGINQFAFISGQVEKTEVARKLDAEPYLRANTRHPHVAAYWEKHAKGPCYYSAGNHLVHRNDNSPMLEYHAGNFFDYGVTFPMLLWQVAEKVGAPKDFLERVTGHKRIADYEPSALTVVDSMFENMLRAMSFGRYLTVGQRRSIEDMLQHCRNDRLAQFEQIWTYCQTLDQLERNEVAAKQALASARQAALQTSVLFTKSTAD
jgi:glycosyltransferase involved in cell wall biosynthesis